MLSNPQWVLRLHTTRRAFLGRPSRVDLYHVTRVLLAVMFEDGDEVTPPYLCLVPRVLWVFEHPFDVEVFNEHGVVLGRVEMRELVLEITLLVRHPSVNLNCTSALFLPVV